MAIDFTKSNRDKNTLKPLALQAYSLLMEELKKNGIDMFPTDFLRTDERQWYLYCQGRTVEQAVKGGVPRSFATKYANPKEKQVTWTLNSNHKSGMAWDLACSPPKALYDKKLLAKAGAIAISLGINWGGSFNDSPHFDIKSNWKPPVKPKPIVEKPKYNIQRVKVDLFGRGILADAINIEGYNYIKLRDLLCDKINVEWNDGKVIVNNQPFNVEGVLYQDYNYTKIRTLEQIGINVDWDSKTNTIILR